jgi:two-component system chemotaxis sensor kinase CheA
MQSVIEKIFGQLSHYESGDLMMVMEIGSSYDQLASLLSNYPGSKDIIQYIQMLRHLTAELPSIKEEKEALELLQKSNESLSSLFKKEISGAEAAIQINPLIPNIAALLKTSKVPQDKAPEESKSRTEYAPEYFAGIVDDPKMLSQLAEEMKEHLDTAQYTLVELEYDDSNQENINKVFRSFHTIKGSSAFLGLKNVEEVAHQMESVLVLIRDGKARISKEIIDIAFFGIELLRSFVSIMETNNFIASKMAESFKKVDIFSYLEVIKGLLAQYEGRKLGEILQEDGKINKLDLHKILDKQNTENKKFGEIALEEKIITAEELNNAIKKQQTLPARKSSFVKVSNDKLNTLIDIVGELVINQSILKQAIQNKEDFLEYSERAISQLEGITTSIKNLVLSMGMVPIAEIFNKLRVVIRNTAADLEKAVVVEMLGEETELDRNVIESIYDPLVHMVRNSIDHGIEKPEAREAAKKDRVGKVTISAEHKGNGIEICVTDDGRGIDKEKIIQKAVDMNLISREKAGSISDKEIYGLMFLPGFSTAEKVTGVSGRGVGLDVVKRNIEEIHGRLEVMSEKGKFTKIIIKLPLTLAIIEGFVTAIGRSKYVFPFSSIDEILVMQKESVSKMENGGYMLFHRGNYIPILFSGKIFQEKDFNEELERSLLIIISHETKNYGIVVDRVIGKQEIVIKNLGDALSEIKIFSGGTIFGDGTIGFVVDVEQFLEEGKKA